MYRPVTEKKEKKKRFFGMRKNNLEPEDDVAKVKKAVKKIADASDMSMKDIPIPIPEPPKQSSPLMYYDKEKKETLYGYSQHNLDAMVKTLHLILIIFGIISIVMFFLTLYVFYIFQKYHVLTQIVNALG